MAVIKVGSKQDLANRAHSALINEVQVDVVRALLHDTLLADNGDNIAERCEAAYKLLCNAFIRRFIDEEECDELNAVINDFEFRFGE